MKRVLRTFGLAIGLALLGVGGGVWGQDDDEDVILRFDDKPVIPCKIDKENYLTVEGVAKTRGRVKVESYLVKDVIFGDRHAYFAQAKDFEKKENWTTAAKAFRMALEAMKGKKWAAEYCAYGMANSFYRAGIFRGYQDRPGHSYRPASEYYQQVIAANPKSRFLLDAVGKYAICLAEESRQEDGAVDMGKVALAEKAFQSAEKQIADYNKEVAAIDMRYKEVSKRAEAVVKLGYAKLLELKGDASKEKDVHAKARREYQQAGQLGVVSGNKEVIGEAFDGELACLIKVEEFDEASSRAQSVVDKYNQTFDKDLLEMLPAAYFSMGKANFASAAKYEKLGQGPQAEAAYDKARWNFMQIVVKFFDKPEYLPKAHFFIGLCFENLKKLETEAPALAAWHYRKVCDFPKSNFASEAKKRLDELGVAPRPEAGGDPGKGDGGKGGPGAGEEGKGKETKGG